MTARDDAVEAVIDGFLQWMDDNGLTGEVYGATVAAAVTTGVDDIPTDVLVRFAIERAGRGVVLDALSEDVKVVRLPSPDD